MTLRLTRTQVPLEETWSLDDLFAGTPEWEAAYAEVDALRGTIGRFQGRVGESAATLTQCLQALDTLQQRHIRVATYAYLRNAEDGSNPDHQAALARVMALSARLGASVAFVESEILQLPRESLLEFLASEPALAGHRIYLQDLLELKPHRLSPDAETALAALGEVMGAPSLIYNRSKSSDMEFAAFTDGGGATHPNSFNQYESRYEMHEDTSVRRGAWESFGRGLKAYNHTYAATFATEIQKNVALARLRGYPSTEAFLLQLHKIPFSLYTQILQIIQTELAPHMRRYARLRQRVLGLDKLLYCDLKSPLDPAYSPRSSYAESCQLIQDALAALGDDYGKFIHRALTSRWVDRADNTGKSSGAFCSSPYGVHPFILITWSESMRCVFTLAHELGHAGHFGLAMRHQGLVNARPALPFVEAPSILHELLLAQHVLNANHDARTRRSIILQVLATFHHNFVTHLLEAELQHQIYGLAQAGRSITAAVLNQRKGDILAKFWGDSVEIDDGACMTWMRQPHYYMGLYPYTYSVGLVAATAMAQAIQTEGPSAGQRWLQALKAGGTLKPIELLQLAGVDLTTPQPIHDAVAYVGRLIDQLESGFADPTPL